MLSSELSCRDAGGYVLYWGPPSHALAGASAFAGSVIVPQSCRSFAGQVYAVVRRSLTRGVRVRECVSEFIVGSGFLLLE